MFESPLANVYDGISRGPYFFGCIGLGLLSVFLRAGFGGSSVSSIVSLVTTVLALVLVVQRLKNIGMSSWWALLMFVPLANIWLGFRCITAQEGYIETRTLDHTGRIIAGLIIGFWVLAGVLVLFALLMRR